MKRKIEVCCDSLEDVIISERAGADRVELNNSMHLGGLTPSIGTIKLVSERCVIPTIVMARPRGAGFCYNDYQYDTMVEDIEEMMKYNISGVAFGCLTKNKEIDIEKNKKIIEILKKNDKEVVFHRAFDCVVDPYKSIEILIDLGVDRILTSGLASKAVEGVELLKELQEKYGQKIEILAGSGVNESNAKYIMDQTGINQYHSSCKTWEIDPTTIGHDVSYAYANSPHENEYNVVRYERVKELVDIVKE
ncbi:copper homeostasis protein CutC [Senegalia massiliensis]|uniref:copper homeostasis protein CutC n=1 Tax=Senegalia massiliensis TaxID=1720316 RepID=UPI001030D7AB|nr:copper homeostasis protein CutC [Senegalia massiliensis]